MTSVVKWELTDFLPEYPSILQENFQSLISAKKEFIETASTVNEPIPEKGKLYKHQLFTQRYLQNYDKVLLADQAGTGKACSMVGVTNYLYEEHLKSLQYDTPYDSKNSHYKQTIVLLKGTSLIKEFKNQLACKCTKDIYDAMLILKNQGKSSENVKLYKIVNKEINKWYKFYTYETFAKYIYNKYDDNVDAMRIDFNHSIIVIDEAHNLFIEEDTDKKIKTDNKWNKDRTYQILFWFLQNVQYSKQLLATATPMLNMMSEFGKLINLILEKQMPTLKDFKTEEALEKYYKKISVEELNSYIQGYVLFVRSFDTGATRVDQVNKDFKCKKCPKINDIYMTEMSKFQSKIYKEVLETKGSSAYSLYLNYASNFVFPDGTFSAPEKEVNHDTKKVNDIKKNASKNIPGLDIEESEESEDSDSEDDSKNGYNKYVIEESIGKKKNIIYKLNKKASPKIVLDTIDDVYQYSCKYATIIEMLEGPGSAFIYGRYNKGSGNIMLGICLEEAAGYERFMEQSSVFESKGVTGDYCQTGTYEKILKPTFVKKNRYALLTSEVLENDGAYNAIMELMNSYENRHGEYLKCIIASRVARDGLNFKNIVKIILTGPDWNPSSMYQAIMRGIRSGSHEDLLAELAKIIIKVYLMAAVPNQKVLKDLGVDIHIYDVSHQKDVNISHLMRKILQCTVGCQIQYNRNVRDTDVDYSSACYYDECQYPCIDDKPKTVDYTTYNAYYIKYDIDILIKMLKINLMTWTQGNMFVINDIIGNFENTYTTIVLALQSMIDNKIPLIDLYGYTTYLYQMDGNYYFNRNYIGDISSSVYSQQLIITNDETNEFFNELNQKNYDYFLKQEDDLLAYFNILSIENKIKFLEEQYIIPDDKYEMITNQYSKMFFKLNELKLSDKPMIKGVLEKKNKGRPKNSDICPGKIVKTNQILYVNLLNLYKDTNKHNFIPFYFKANTLIRIYNPEEGYWRTASACENELYAKKLENMNNKKFNKMQLKYDNLFGIDIGGEMLIVYEEENAKKKKEEELSVSRSEARGRKCESYNKEILEDIALKLEINKSDIYENKKLKTIDQLCFVIKNKLVEDNRIL